MITEKQLQDKLKAGKIRGYTIPPKDRSQKTRKNSHKSKALTWLKLNLQYWSRENNLKLETEYRFHPTKRYRFDWAIVSKKLAIEYEGGVFMKRSGHSSPKGYTKDTDKYNSATALGWRIIRVTAMNYKTLFEQLNSFM